MSSGALPKLLEGALSVVLIALSVLIGAVLVLAFVASSVYTVVEVVGSWF